MRILLALCLAVSFATSAHAGLPPEVLLQHSAKLHNRALSPSCLQIRTQAVQYKNIMEQTMLMASTHLGSVGGSSGGWASNLGGRLIQLATMPLLLGIAGNINMMSANLDTNYTRFCDSPLN